MKTFELLSRRNVGAKDKADFRPDDPRGGSPFAQLRRLRRALEQSELKPDDFTDMDDAVAAFREYSYRKVFSGTTHDEFVELDQTDPKRIDWLLAVAAVDAEIWQDKKRNR